VARGIGLANPGKNLSIHWRATTSRLLLAYGVFFVIWGTVLLGFIYWETLHYLEVRTDLQLKQQVTYLRGLDREHMESGCMAIFCSFLTV